MYQKTPLCKGAAIGLSRADIAAVVKTSAEIQKIYAEGINPDGSLKPEAIRSLLKLKGINVKIFAETKGLVDPQIHQVINREYPDLRVRRLLADALGLPYECVWGEVANAS
jgi:lambda repressor-like predicted transcriptional regulator